LSSRGWLGATLPPFVHRIFSPLQNSRLTRLSWSQLASVARCLVPPVQLLCPLETDKNPAGLSSLDGRNFRSHLPLRMGVLLVIRHRSLVALSSIWPLLSDEDSVSGTDVGGARGRLTSKSTVWYHRCQTDSFLKVSEHRVLWKVTGCSLQIRATSCSVLFGG
jgi:hypothetical protein